MDPNAKSNDAEKEEVTPVRRDSGYASHGNLSPVYSPSKDNKVAQKRKRVVEIEGCEMEKNLFSFNAKMKRKFVNDQKSCSEKEIRVKSEIDDFIEIDAAKCSRAKNKAYRQKLQKMFVENEKIIQNKVDEHGEMVLNNDVYLKYIELDEEPIKKIRSSIYENVGKKIARMLIADGIDIESVLKK